MWQWFRRMARAVGLGGLTPEQTRVLARYQHLRQTGLQLNHRLAETLSKSALDEGGRKLGILKGGRLVLESEDQIAVLVDFCIYDVRREGVNAIERYLAASPPPPGSDESVLLEAMRQAHYALLVIESHVRGLGAHVRDLLRDEALFLVDVGFSRTAPVGLILAARVMAPEGIAQTTGAPLPVGLLLGEERAGLLQSLGSKYKGTDFRSLSPQKASELAASIIRTALQRGAAQLIAYAGPRSASVPGRALPPAQSVGRNDRCPCGSGKKFKNCCGAR
jgi:SEC-C motif